MSIKSLIEESDRRARARAKEFKFGAATHHLLILPFFSVGWVLGKLVWLIRYMLGLVLAGYNMGRGE